MNASTFTTGGTVAVEIYECATGRVVHSLRVPLESWMDDVDQSSAINEHVLRWCSDNGYAFGDEATWTIVA